MLPIELSWTILVFLPKCKVNNRGIGTLEVLWKVVEAIIDTRIKTAVIFNDVLHGFRACRGTETAIVEIKMSRKLASINQDPLSLVFLDLRKVYNTLYHGRLLQTLGGYGADLKVWGILEEFWKTQKMVTR